MYDINGCQEGFIQEKCPYHVKLAPLKYLKKLKEFKESATHKP